MLKDEATIREWTRDICLKYPLLIEVATAAGTRSTLLAVATTTEVRSSLQWTRTRAERVAIHIEVIQTRLQKRWINRHQSMALLHLPRTSLEDAQLPKYVALFSPSLTRVGLHPRFFWITRKIRGEVSLRTPRREHIVCLHTFEGFWWLNQEFTQY